MSSGKRYVVEAATLAALLDRLPRAFLLLDWSSGRIDHANAAARQLLGAELQGLVGRDVEAWFSGSQTLRGGLAAQAQIGATWVTGRARRPDGTSFEAAILIEELPNEAGRLVSIEARSNGGPDADTTDVAALIEAAGLAGMAALMSGLAHELSQPLTAVANYVQTSEALLGEVLGDFPAVAEAMQEAASEALRAARIMRTIRHDLASRSAQRTRVALRPLISDACRLALLGTGGGRPDIALVLRPDISEVLADRRQLQLALVMLLQTAAGLSGPNAPIVVETDIVPGQIMIAISWIGKHPEVTAAAWRRPFAGDLDTSQLTLSICRSIIVAHGGELRVHQDGERSTLSIAAGPGDLTNGL
ncbi:MAG: PAS domain-containing sensor histidine kinase [Sphingomonadales bacterium]|nr:PAS domain-containing sensor histidine kinase [Sphingomonadales bacterium]